MEEANKQKEWEREEVVILVSEYFKTKGLSNNERDKCQIEISEFLKNREKIISGIEPSEIFRDYAGIHMQMARIQCLDPKAKYVGMRGTKLQKEIVQEYLNNPEVIIAEAKEIYRKYGQKSSC